VVRDKGDISRLDASFGLPQSAPTVAWTCAVRRWLFEIAARRTRDRPRTLFRIAEHPAPAGLFLDVPGHGSEVPDGPHWPTLVNAEFREQVLVREPLLPVGRGDGHPGPVWRV